ncbi:MAG: hypothetical protein HOV81_09465 [Kofleriaceae bacterium]|nr:hypothetical protein [Kofleriaceae bacterium]
MRIVVIATLLAMTSMAAAQAPGQTLSWDPELPPPRLEPVTVSYRGQIITADIVALGLMVLGPQSDEHGLSLSGLGFTGWFLAAPLIHAAHGRGGAAAKSLGLRIGLPILGGIAGYRLGPDDTSCVYTPAVDGRPSEGGCGDHGSVIGALLGIAAGAGTAMYIDAKYLARYQTERAVTWSAGIAPMRGGASLSFSGSF